MPEEQKMVKIRYTGNKKPKHVDLPIGANSTLSQMKSTVVCDPVGEFPEDQAKLLLATPGASGLFVPEDEYQAQQDPNSEVAQRLKREAAQERARRMNEANAERREKERSSAPTVAEEEFEKKESGEDEPSDDDTSDDDEKKDKRKKK